MLDEILESATAVTSDSEDYRGEDGLLYCGKCHTPREAYFPKGITLLGKNRHPIECVCRRMEREQKKNTGLLIWGGVGTGKSFFAGCIANALMEREVPVCMTNFARILNELNNSFSGRNEVV